VAPAFEAEAHDAMSRKPRKPTEGIFDSIMINQTVESGLVMGLIAFAA